MQPSKSRYGMLAMAALAVAAIGGFGWKFQREHQMSQDLFDKPMHTLCVGRHLIDVPAQYVLEYHRYRIDGVEIESLGEMQDEAAFKAELSKREAELSQEKNEYGKLLSFIHETDEHAFVTVSTVNEVVGAWNTVKSR